jgi:hypothetical protein
MTQEYKTYEVTHIELLAEILQELKNISVKLDKVEGNTSGGASNFLKQVEEGLKSKGTKFSL